MAFTMNTPSSKRPRAPSASSSASPATSPGSSDPPHKASRILFSSASSYDTSSTVGSDTTTLHDFSPAPANARPLLCSLPPTCHQHPTPIANTNELERHYAMYHAHVCEVDKCGCVFTDARLLELHQTECHDPIAALRKERGEKIFQCHLPAPTCGRNFLTPKARRLHLIQSHAYPKEYFFAVTNKGIGGLLKKWGDGASMIRKEWKPREQSKGKAVDMKKYRDGDDDKMDEDEDEDEEEDSDDQEEDESEGDGEGEREVYDADENAEDEPADLEATPRMLPRTTGIHSPQSSISSSKSRNRHPRHQNQHRTNNDASADNAGVAGLADSLDSLSLVPNSIRFGRGGKSGGFIPNNRGVRGRGRARGGPGGAQSVNARGMDVDHSRGMGYRGGARGGAPTVPAAGHADTPQTEWVARGRGRGRALPRSHGRGRGRGF